MSRAARPWFRKTHMEWFTTIGGRQVRLHVKDPNDFEAALAAFVKITGRLPDPEPAPPDPSPPPPPDPPPVAPPARARTVAEVAAEFLAKKKPKVGADCWKVYSTVLNAWLVPVFGPRAVGSLAAEEVEEWADEPRPVRGSKDLAQWSSSTRHDYLGVVMTLMKWAGCPLPLKRPPKESRGADAVLSDAQFLAVLKHAGPGDFGDLLRVLRETGARPQEVARLTAEAVDWGNACTRVREHKTARHGVARVVHFNAAALAILTALRAKHGTGHLFRGRDNKPYTKDAIGQRMRRISERSGVHATAYGLGRHTFATAALVAGVPPAVVAALLGHKGTAMLDRHYSHVAGQAQVLRDALAKMKRPA